VRSFTCVFWTVLARPPPCARARSFARPIPRDADLCSAAVFPGPKLGREVLETMVNKSLAGPAVANTADAEFKGACKGLLVACERWSLLSECSYVLQLLSQAGIEMPFAFHGRLIDAGEDWGNTCARKRASEQTEMLHAHILTADFRTPPPRSALALPPTSPPPPSKFSLVAHRLSQSASTLPENLFVSGAGGGGSETGCLARAEIEREALKAEALKAFPQPASRADAPGPSGVCSYVENTFYPYTGHLCLPLGNLRHVPMLIAEAKALPPLVRALVLQPKP
jgi:hypothetical protein